MVLIPDCIWNVGWRAPRPRWGYSLLSLLQVVPAMAGLNQVQMLELARVPSLAARPF